MAHAPSPAAAPMPAEPQSKPVASVTITVRGVGAGVLLDVEPPEITSVGTAPAGPARIAAMTRAGSTAVMMRVARMGALLGGRDRVTRSMPGRSPALVIGGPFAPIS